MSRLLKIVVAEPSAIVRQGLITVIGGLNGFKTDVYEVAEAEQLKTCLPWQKPDLLIVNPLLTGISALPNIRRASNNHQMRVAALQTSAVDTTLFAGFDEIISLADSLATVREKIAGLFVPSDDEKKPESLSYREKEIISCVIKGMTNKEIAAKLNLSSHTIVSHRRNISAKLQIHSAAGLTVYAIVNKLVSLEDIEK